MIFRQQYTIFIFVIFISCFWWDTDCDTWFRKPKKSNECQIELDFYNILLLLYTWGWILFPFYVVKNNKVFPKFHFKTWCTSTFEVLVENRYDVIKSSLIFFLHRIQITRVWTRLEHELWTFKILPFERIFSQSHHHKSI